ncbi:MAG TPA: hypothetical protein VF440_07695 [Novosphingobium sp.]
MRHAALIGLFALMPAAINPAQAAPSPSRSLTSLVCSGNGPALRIAIPVDGDHLPSKDDRPCWAKGCHAGSSRKRTFRFS